MKRGADKMCFKTSREKVVDVRREEGLKKFLTFEGRRIGEKKKVEKTEKRRGRDSGSSRQTRRAG